MLILPIALGALLYGGGYIAQFFYNYDVNIFLNQIVLRRGLPFEVTLPVKTPVAAGSLTSDEFYAEVKRGYDDCAAGRTRPAEDVFRDIEAEFGL